MKCILMPENIFLAFVLRIMETDKTSVETSKHKISQTKYFYKMKMFL